MFDIKITLHGAQAVTRKLTALKEITSVQRRDILEGVGFRATRSVKRGIRNGVSPDGTVYPPVTRFGEPGQRLQDTKHLMNSITYQVGNGRVIVGTNVKYAAMQHYGGTQRPSKAKMLAIPLTRQVARAVASSGGYREAFPGAFIFRSKAGNLILARRKDGEIDPIAVLKKSVRIQGTKFLGLSKEGQDEIVRYIETMIRRAVGEGK